jgi:hypothetical protein
VNQHHDQWRQFKFWNRLGIGAVLTIVPLFFVVAVVGNRFPSLLPGLIAVVCIWVAAYFGAYIRLRSFKCPRCSRPYLVRSTFGTNSLGRKCVHCGLRLYTDA